MATVSTLVKLFGISKKTVRTWAAEFSDFLSPDANPALGQRRRFSREDIAVLGLIASMRQQNAPFPEIRAALQAGQRLDISPRHVEMVVSNLPADSSGPALVPGYAPVELIESFAQRLTRQFQEQINQLRDQIERLERQKDYFRDKFEEAQAQVESDRVRWIEAEKTIARQEAELQAAANQAKLLAEERTARLNAMNRLATAQAKAERLEALLQAAEEQQKGRRRSLLRR